MLALHILLWLYCEHSTIKHNRSATASERCPNQYNCKIIVIGRHLWNGWHHIRTACLQNTEFGTFCQSNVFFNNVQYTIFFFFGVDSPNILRYPGLEIAICMNISLPQLLSHANRNQYEASRTLWNEIKNCSSSSLNCVANVGHGANASMKLAWLAGFQLVLHKQLSVHRIMLSRSGSKYFLVISVDMDKTRRYNTSIFGGCFRTW